MIVKVTVHLTDGTERSHTYPFEVNSHDGVLRIHVENGNRTIAYPLTSVLSWSVER